MKSRILGLLCLSSLWCIPASAEQIGEVDTAFKLIGANHKVLVEVFDDPAVNGISCYISRAKAGGVAGWVGWAQDKSDASVACRQSGTEMSFTKTLPVQEEVFTEKQSFLFKRLRVVRMVDGKRRMIVYLVYSDKLIDGSPNNSITAVPIPANVSFTVVPK